MAVIMIILVGGSGYLGQAFAGALKKRSEPFLSVSRAQVDYTRYDLLVDFLSRARCSFLINAAGYTGKPNVDACETARAETLQGNTLLPLTLAHAELARLAWTHRVEKSRNNDRQASLSRVSHRQELIH